MSFHLNRRTLALSISDHFMSAPNDNVLIVPSRNVLLTGSVLRGGFRNISHDATRWYEKAGPPRDVLKSRKTHSIGCKKETGL